MKQIKKYKSVLIFLLIALVIVAVEYVVLTDRELFHFDFLDKDKTDQSVKGDDSQDVVPVEVASIGELDGVKENATSKVDYFEGAKMDREQVRESNKSALEGILNSENISEEQRTETESLLAELNGIIEKETAAEDQLVAKGYEEVIVRLDDGGADVVIREDDLTAEKVAEIEDIIKQTTDVAAGSIIITPIIANK
ncbi:MAG: SpoIIIAH-like family protein [Herbinix sp.]|jgi:hypothetical protein|nr:SpoIIIAH-like family protein [Herbinix sp.]